MTSKPTPLNQIRGLNALSTHGINWPIVLWIVLAHILACFAPFYFTWPAFVVAVVLAFATGSLGVCMGYHRLLTHQSFRTYRPIRLALAVLGGLSGEGSALTWVATHRQHHLYSDKDGDPHSPNDGAWWSHMLWFMPNYGKQVDQATIDKFASDLRDDPAMVTIHRLFIPSHLILAWLLSVVGYCCGGDQMALSMLFWGMGVRMVYVLHVTWFVNSLTHLWGYRTYETSDNSRNNWLVGILAWGEGWHNNHHAYQQVASQGHRWWEFDPTYWVILCMEKIGLAWRVVRLEDVKR